MTPTKSNRRHRAPAVAPAWRYSLRWALPHRPCPGPRELAAVEVPAGTPCPASILDLWRPGTGYAVSIDFPPGIVRNWSDEARAKVRRQNLERRLQKTAPLFYAELLARELEARPDYFQGKRLVR